MLYISSSRLAPSVSAFNLHSIRAQGFDYNFEWMILRGAIFNSTRSLSRDDSHEFLFIDLVQRKNLRRWVNEWRIIWVEITASVNDFNTRLTTGDRTASSHESMSVDDEKDEKEGKKSPTNVFLIGLWSRASLLEATWNVAIAKCL